MAASASFFTSACQAADPLTPERFQARGDGRTDDTRALASMLAALSPGARAVISRVHKTSEPLVVPRGATIEFARSGKIRYVGAEVALDCSAGGFHLINPRIQGPGKGPLAASTVGNGTGIWIDGTWRGAGRSPEYVVGGRIDRPHIYNFPRSGIETRLWADGVITAPHIHDCRYAGILNQNSRGFRGHGPGLIVNIGPSSSGNAYGHTNTRRTDGVYDRDLVASPRSVNARVQGWTGRNIPWNAFDTHAGEDIVYIDCVAEECTFPFGLVGSSGIFGVQRSGLVRPIVRNDPRGRTFALLRSSVSEGVNPPIVIQGALDGREPATDCFVTDAVLEFTGQDTSNSGCILASHTRNLKVSGVRGRGCLKSLIVMHTANQNFLVEDITSVDLGSDSQAAVDVVTISSKGGGGNEGAVRNVAAEWTGVVDLKHRTRSLVYAGNSARNAVDANGLSSRTVPLVGGSGVGLRGSDH